MSEIKYIARPKVRFSETSESTDDSTSSSRPTSSRLRIKNIENVKKPFKLVREVRDGLNLKTAGKIESLQVSDKKIKSPEKEPTNELTDKLKNNSSKLESDKENIKTNKQTKNPAIKSTLRNFPAKKDNQKSKDMEKLTKILDSVSIETSSELKPTKFNNFHKKPGKIIDSNAVKTNFTNGNKKSTSNQLKTTGTYKPSVTQTKISSGIKIKSSDTQSKVQKMLPRPKLQSKSLLQVNKSENIQKPQIKISTARNKSIARPNVYVGPGILKSQVSHNPPEILDRKTGIKTINSSSSTKLYKPEYNSVINTIKKIDKSKSNKIVTDFKHLPNPCKDFVVKKMSSALDFPADKPIFKDLIDLSVDESHLPERITRTKDPQPRQKDMEPRLEDFFEPAFEEEYCTSVKIRPKTPEFDDNLSAFKISDRIFDWKFSLDE